MTFLQCVTPGATRTLRRAIDSDTERAATAIVHDVRDNGEPALLRYAAHFGEVMPNGVWRYERAELSRARDALDKDARGLLERTASRIAAFATAQRDSLHAMSVNVPGGTAGHTIVPMQRAGCYAPAGRFPLPSSLLMTAVTARVAGVVDVIAATPRPSALMLGAAAIADVDVVIGVGGAHAIAGLAYGVGTEPCDIVVGPGNKWVTAAKRIVAGDVAIDMLAGPSELVVAADASANAATIAADLLAQAEHDPDALVALVTDSSELVVKVERELEAKLVSLPTAETARASLANGVAVVCANLDEMIAACNRFAPEHMQICVRESDEFASQIRTAGACFIGERSAEVFGDYGIGGNHVLPTGGSARFASGLSALTFMRMHSWLCIEDPSVAVQDVAAFARLEGLEGHARAADLRRLTRR